MLWTKIKVAQNDRKMNYIISEKGLGIVILGGFIPLEVNVDSLTVNHVIRQGEGAFCHQDMAEAERSVFNIGNIRIMCDRYRLQVATIDTQMISRMLEFCRDLMNVVSINDIRGVGVNPHLRIRLNNQEEYQYFVSHAMPPMERWNTLLPTGQMINMNIKDGHRSLEVTFSEKNNEKLYAFDINLHHQLNNAGAVIDVLDTAQDAYNRELESVENFLHGL